MTSNESKNEMLVMALTDLTTICKMLAENSAVQHYHGESLIIKIARFLPSVLDVQARPS
jgi:hypothetical protein